jgi:hypothetical protein
MPIASRTPEGSWNSCTLCGAHVVIEPSSPPGDAPCPACGHLLWFSSTPLVCERIELAPPEEEGFDAEAWRNGSMRLRGSQVQNLLGRGLLPGLTKPQVVELLGAPDESAEGFLGYALDCGVRVTYRGSPHRLRVQFSAEGLVSEASVVER